MRAYVLHSGGIDSTTALYRALQDHEQDAVISVGFDYGQRHKEKESQCAADVCQELDIKRIILNIADMPKSMLTDSSAPIPEVAYHELPHGVSPTYVPFRNGQFIAKVAALASADKDEPAQIYMGMHADDAAHDAYPDCTLEFIGAMASAVYVGTYHKVRLVAPFLQLYKHDIIKIGDQLQVPYEHTWSCYKGEELHCGVCPTCRARKDAFLNAGVFDPTVYKKTQQEIDDETPF